MRIVYVLTLLGVGGTERQVSALAGRMAARGHDVALMVLRPSFPDELIIGLPITHLDIEKTPWSVLRGLARGVRFLRKFRPDLVHSHNFHGNILARITKVFYPTAPVISTVHNVYEGGWLRMLAYGLTDGLSRLSIAVSNAAAERYVRLRAVPQRKCRVICNGIDPVEFAPDPPRPAAMRERMGAHRQFIWLAAGRIAPAKDYPNLLRAFATVRKTEIKVQLWIAADTTSAAAAEMRTLATQLGLNEAVRWLGLRHDMPALLDTADGFLLASAWEGMPLALGEAMAMEKPVVATDVGGVRELMGDAGTVVPSKDAAALAAAMLAVMQTPFDVRRVQGKSARERIIAGFNIEAKTDEWESTYLSVIKPSARTENPL